MQEFSKDKLYKTDDVVLHEGVLYQAITPSWGIKPPAFAWSVVIPETPTPIPKVVKPAKEAPKEKIIIVEKVVEKIVEKPVRPPLSSFWIE